MSDRVSDRPALGLAIMIVIASFLRGMIIGGILRYLKYLDGDCRSFGSFY